MIDKLVDGLARMIMGVSALLVFAITFLQVLCRFVLKSPLPWSTDIVYLFGVLGSCLVRQGEGAFKRRCGSYSSSSRDTQVDRNFD